MQIDLISETTDELIDSFEVSDEEFARWAQAAKSHGQTIEEFMHEAIALLAENFKQTG